MVRDAPPLRSGAPHYDTAGRLEPPQRAGTGMLYSPPCGGSSGVKPLRDN